MELLKAVLFDLDGTLLDNSEIVIEAYYSGMLKLGYKPKNREFIRSILGQSTFATGRDLGIREEDLPKIDSYFWNYFGNSANDPKYIPRVYPGVKDFLIFLKSNNIPTAICTSNKAEYALILMKKVKLDNYFSAVIGSEDVANKKPAPDIIYEALKRLRITKINSKDNLIWYVGDSRSDVLAAKSGDIFSIAIPENDKMEEIEKLVPDRIFKSMDELLLFCRLNYGR